MYQHEKSNLIDYNNTQHQGHFSAKLVLYFLLLLLILLVHFADNTFT